MRERACQILGVAINATDDEIKTAYKTLVKQYHPDTGNAYNTDYYNAIVQAYQYLKENPYVPQPRIMGSGKVLGGTANIAKNTYAYSRDKEYAKFEKGYQKKREERIATLERQAKEEREKKERYDRAMEAINAIRVAEAIKTLINETKD